MVEQWYKEAELQTLVHSTEKTDFIIYKGFKISKHKIDNSFTIQDCRFTDLLSEISKEDNLIITDLGFIKGVDLLSHRRDVIREKKYRSILETLYTKRAIYKKAKPFNKKRLSNCEDNIIKCRDLLFYYLVRLEQYKEKYNN